MIQEKQICAELLMRASKRLVRKTVTSGKKGLIKGQRKWMSEGKRPLSTAWCPESDQFFDLSFLGSSKGLPR